MKNNKFTCLVFNPKEMSLLRWIVGDAYKYYSLTHRQYTCVLPALKKKLRKEKTK